MTDNKIDIFIKQPIYFLFLIIFLSFPMSCAFDLANIKPSSTTIIPCNSNCGSFIIAEEVELNNLTCGYNRTIKQGTKWIKFGEIPEGDIYRPVDTCFTIECSNVFEAYLVLNKETILGFYLPVEKGFVPIKEPTKLITQ